MSENIKFHDAYLLDNLNSAIITTDGPSFFYDNYSRKVSEMDGYRWSQINLLKPQLIPVFIARFQFQSWEDRKYRRGYSQDEVSFTITEYLSLEIEKKTRKDIRWAIQLMDATLSDIYRGQVKNLLKDNIKNRGDFDELYLALYSRVLSKKADPQLAIDILSPDDAPLIALYTHLSAHTRLMKILKMTFYSHFDSDEEEWVEIDTILESERVYYQYAVALKEESKRLFVLTTDYFAGKFAVLSGFLKRNINKILYDLAGNHHILLNDQEDPSKYYFRHLYPFLKLVNPFSTAHEAIYYYLSRNNSFESGLPLILKEFWDPILLADKDRDIEHAVCHRLKDEFHFYIMDKGYTTSPVTKTMSARWTEMQNIIQYSAIQSERDLVKDWLLIHIYFAMQKFELAEQTINLALKKLIKTNYLLSILHFELSLKLVICSLKSNKSKEAEKRLEDCSTVLYDMSFPKSHLHVLGFSPSKKFFNELALKLHEIWSLVKTEQERQTEREARRNALPSFRIVPKKKPN